MPRWHWPVTGYGEAAAHAAKVAFPNLGDESFAASSASSGSTTVYVRRGGLVADVSASSSLDPSVLAAIARAVDGAMEDALAGKQPSSIPLSDAGSPTPTPSPPPSPSPSSPATPVAVSHAAPDLEALLPRVVRSTTLASQSTIGTSVLSSDPASQSLVASLAKLGKTPADLQIAEAKDASGHLDLAVFAYRANGVTSAQLSAALADSLLAGSSSGVRSAATLAGRAVTRLSYSQGDIYLYAAGTVTFAIQTADQSTASEVIGLLK